ncbi:uncharacterized protein LOC143856512 isoform X2 [Tasmannia lanceolata]|uniref:uncharacterized protein LOC143856512 isoform X2 n=1 Tax=Tasmannia lanceolata TaxID=3420 RepID=UPI0040638F1D
MKAPKGKGATKKETKEVLKPVEDRKVGKRKAAIKADKSSKRRVKKQKAAKKDPNKPKRPPSAFFVFLEEFRKTFKLEHPNVKAVSANYRLGKPGERSGSRCLVLRKRHMKPKLQRRRESMKNLFQLTTRNRKVWLMMVMRSLIGQNLKSKMMRKVKRRRRMTMNELDDLYALGILTKTSDEGSSASGRSEHFALLVLVTNESFGLSIVYIL